MRMKTNRMRSGSALLIVLGMMSFMLFSGLAFSVYMRYARLPTSFLRRTTTTRQLAKAALAEAIEEIDMAIGNNPHPGVNPNGYTSGVVSNIWHHRVFFGSGDNVAESQITPNPLYPAVLTFEGLAYLPPNMINDVRYYSRCTPTANWRPFWFDSGRYAYTAVDVSDYFDVNKVFANMSRAACATRRITLAHLFETGGAEHSGAGSGASKWDDEIMPKWCTVDDKTGQFTYSDQGPLVSLADFNIAWGSTTLTMGDLKVTNPFRRMATSSDGNPYEGVTSTSDPQAETYRQMTFINESWTPSDAVGKTPDGTKTTVDLASEQPFDINDLHDTMPSLDRTVMRYQSDLLKTNDRRANLYDHICLLGYAQLWDYLDPDNIPVSLAIPTLERVPMIVGVQPSLPNIKIEKGDKTPDEKISGDDKSRRMRRVQTYNLNLATQNVGLRVLAAYPFRDHGVNDEDDSFQLDGRIEIFFTANGQNMSLRPGEANEAFQLKKNNLTAGGFLNESVMSIPLTAQDVSAKEIAKNEDQPVKAVPLTGKIGDVKDGTQFLTVAYEWDQQNVNGQWIPADPTDNDIVENGTAFAFRPLNADGTPNPTPDNLVNNLKNGTGVKLKVNAAVWARVSQGSKTVDLVPACLLDDDELNGGNNASTLMNQLGKAYPLLRYDVKASGQEEVELTLKNLETGPTYQLAIDNPKAFVSDPRYNHMPENWYTVAGNGNLTEQEWMTEAAKMVGQDGRDSDVFLFTSDQGYLQSVYELAFLPRFGGLTKDTKGDARFGDYISSRTKDIDKDFANLATSYDAVLDYGKMWRTYRCYGDKRDPFEDIGLVSGATGPRVNPYSDSTNVLMAAFANTPHDWRLAATNSQWSTMPAATFNAKHAWNAYSSDDTGTICWECLANVAGQLSDKVRKKEYAGDWEGAFEDLGWSDDKRKLLDTLEELDSDDASVYGVDKKFFYGFWHDCFAAQQQLFLIFVRAEPVMMGGGVAGQSPPQLGARAVALVWRDPSAFKDASGARAKGGDAVTPDIHRTRILFYHPFD